MVFSLYNTRFHLLDENIDYGLKAPTEESPQSIWFNILVDDIKKTWEKGIKEGFVEISPINYMEAMGVSNGVFIDPFGYTWMIQQIHKEVSFEEREEYFKKEFNQG